MKRRKFIQHTALSSLFLVSCKKLLHKDKTQEEKRVLKHNINHSVCRWCFDSIPLEELLQELIAMGVTAIDLVGPEDWSLLKKHNIYCSMCNGAEISLTEGWNNPKYHEQLIKNYLNIIPQVAKARYKNLICFSGNRDGIEDTTGLQNCVKGLSKIMPVAEKHGVVVQMELFNETDHPGYMCNSTKWGVALCKAINSNNFKLLYDIYHMQVQEGNIISTIRNNYSYFGHYHTAGVPGRHEIDQTQELYYPAIMRAISETGYKGYVAQEFIPTRPNKIQSLEEAFLVCDI